MSHISFPRFASHAASGRGLLDNDQLRRFAPSAFATGKQESRSDRYTYILTSAVIDGLRADGFEPTFAKQGGSRIAGKAEVHQAPAALPRPGPVAGNAQGGDPSPR